MPSARDQRHPGRSTRRSSLRVRRARRRELGERIRNGDLRETYHAAWTVFSSGLEAYLVGLAILAAVVGAGAALVTIGRARQAGRVGRPAPEPNERLGGVRRAR